MMVFFKKKKEELPPLPEKVPLPELPPLPPLPEESTTLEAPELPSAPEKISPPPPEEIPTVPERAKVFVRIDKYKEVMRLIDSMQHKVNELQKTLDKIAAIKTKEGEIIAGWNALLAEAKSRIEEIDRKLMKPEA